MKKLFGRKTQSAPQQTCRSVLATRYQLTSTNFSATSVAVVRQLQNAGYQAYIVGGGVRDLLMQQTPKDFDVATNAKPEQIKRLFRRCFLIGRRFRLAHVHIKNEIVEVATFRAEQPKQSKAHGKIRGGMIIRDNTYGTLQEDALRRDFTINALYYDPTSNSIIDFTSGLVDLEKRQLRIIGKAKQRYQEDPVRILRAIRLANKLGLQIEASTADPLAKLAPLLANVPAARLAEEIPKLFWQDQAWQCLQTLDDYRLFVQLFPTTYSSFNNNKTFYNFIKLIIHQAKPHLKTNKTHHINLLFAAFLWQPLQNQLQQNPVTKADFDKACADVLRIQSKQVLITRKQSEKIRAIWQLQHRLEFRRPHYIYQTLKHADFHSAYHFLSLRAKAGEPLQAITRWWDNFIVSNKAQRAAMMANLKQ